MFVRQKRIGRYTYVYLVETVREDGEQTETNHANAHRFPGQAAAYPGRFSVRVATWLPRLLPRSVVVSAAALTTGKMGLAS